MNALARRKLQRITLRGIDDLIERGVTLPARLMSYRVAHTAERRWPFIDPFGWVTINGAHVLIGEAEGGSAGGGGGEGGGGTGGSGGQVDSAVNEMKGGSATEGGVALEYVASSKFGGDIHNAEGKLPKVIAKEQYLQSKYNTPEFRKSFTDQYNKTQDVLSKEHPDGQITLYRGIKDDSLPSSGTASVKMDSLSSWTSDLNIARSFARARGGVVMRMSTSIKNVWAYPKSNSVLGRTLDNEQEHLLLGGKQVFNIEVVK